MFIHSSSLHLYRRRCVVNLLTALMEVLQTLSFRTPFFIHTVFFFHRRCHFHHFWCYVNVVIYVCCYILLVLDCLAFQISMIVYCFLFCMLSFFLPFPLHSLQFISLPSVGCHFNFCRHFCFNVISSYNYNVGCVCVDQRWR